MIIFMNLESGLRDRLSDERKREMERYGRLNTYDKIFHFLDGNRRIAFSLVNHSLAIIDDELDTNLNIKQLDKARLILTKFFNKETMNIEEEWEKDIQLLGQTLLELKNDGYHYAADVFDEVISYWDIEEENFRRKGKILDPSTLDRINLEIGKKVSKQFLYLLCPDLKKDEIEIISHYYGFAIKLADNLVDLEEDASVGFFNISKMDVDTYSTDFTNISRDYILKEFERAKEQYLKGDEVHKKFEDEGLSLFREFCYSWFRQASEFCFIQELKSYDISDGSLKFIHPEKIKAFEETYKVRLSQIIKLSYEQEDYQYNRNVF